MFESLLLIFRKSVSQNGWMKYVSSKMFVLCFVLYYMCNHLKFELFALCKNIVAETECEFKETVDHKINNK
jgi:hypothetical protein